MTATGSSPRGKVEEPMQEGTEHQTRGGILAEISTGLVSLHRRFYGKGPTKAKTFLVNDTVMCMLRGGFTTVERTLIDDGKSAAVHDIRRSFQETMEREFTAVVERATGRKVIAYMSQVHSDPDLAVELFVLEAHADAGASATGEALPTIAAGHEQDFEDEGKLAETG